MAQAVPVQVRRQRGQASAGLIEDGEAGVAVKEAAGEPIEPGAGQFTVKDTLQPLLIGLAHGSDSVERDVYGILLVCAW
jgi:hypothetical protein